MTRMESYCQYIRLNQILLLAIGLWPYKQSILVRFQVFLFFGVLISFIILQITIFFTIKCTSDDIINISSFILLFVAFVVKYNSFWVNSETVRCLLDQLQQIYNELKDENEIIIINKYGYDSKCYTIRIILITICSSFVVFFLSIWPRILDIILPMNESRPYFGKESLARFINQEKYLNIIMLHMNVAIFVGGTAFIATGTMLIVFLKYVCGMFKIASYRIEQAMAIKFLQNSQKNEIMIYKKITSAIDIHRKAMKFAKYFIYNFEGSFFVLIGVMVCCLSLNLFLFFRALSLGNNNEEFFLHFLIGAIMLLYMFLANYAGQEIMDYNNHVYSTAYNVHWYIAPLHMQKLILFLLQRGNKSFSLNVGGLFEASLKCFASLTSASISYFTVIYSTQQSEDISSSLLK